MRAPLLTTVILIGWLTGLNSPCSAIAQSEAGSMARSSPTSSPALTSPNAGVVSDVTLRDKEREIEEELSTDLKSGQMTRAQVELAGAELANIRTQQDELALRDNGLNATDAEFLQGRIRQLKGGFGPHALGETGMAGPALGGSLNDEVPGALGCDTKRALLAVGRDHAVATVQRYGSANVALIVEAVASPYQRADTMSLHVAGGGLNAKIDGARDGAYLVASTTANFSLKSKHKVTITADVVTPNGAAPQYVKIWGSCSTR
jgi:hypothetical protein